MGTTTFNSFAAVDSSRTPVGQIQGVELQGDRIVKARFLTSSAIFGARRCITISSGEIAARGSSIVLPISQAQLFAQIGG